jgi:hypothetical protein
LAYRYSIDPAHRRVEIVFEGTLTPDDLGGIRADAIGDPGFDSTFDYLVDGSKVTRLVDVGTREIHFLAGNRSEVHVAGARRALVAPMDVGFGLSRMFQGMADLDGDVRVFRDRDEALAWLNGE